MYIVGFHNVSKRFEECGTVLSLLGVEPQFLGCPSGATGSLVKFMFPYQHGRGRIPEESPILHLRNLRPLLTELGLSLDKVCGVEYKNLCLKNSLYFH
jgi:hypothetical protein